MNKTASNEHTTNQYPIDYVFAKGFPSLMFDQLNKNNISCLAKLLGKNVDEVNLDDFRSFLITSLFTCLDTYLEFDVEKFVNAED